MQIECRSFELVRKLIPKCSLSYQNVSRVQNNQARLRLLCQDASCLIQRQRKSSAEQSSTLEIVMPRRILSYSKAASRLQQHRHAFRPFFLPNKRNILILGIDYKTNGQISSHHTRMRLCQTILAPPSKRTTHQLPRQTFPHRLRRRHSNATDESTLQTQSHAAYLHFPPARRPLLRAARAALHHGAHGIVRRSDNPPAGRRVRLFKPLLEYSTHGLTVDFKPFPRESHVIYEDNTLTVRTIPLKHRLPCVGFVFKEKPKLRHINRAMVDFHQVPVRTLPSIRSGADFTKPDGTVIPNKMLTTPPDPVRMYAYVSDTLPLTAVADEVRGADLLFTTKPLSSATCTIGQKETFHSTARDAGRIARLAEAKRLIVGHFSSRYLNEQPILDEAKAEFPDTILAREMLSIDI